MDKLKHTAGNWFINGPFVSDNDLFIRTNIHGEGFDIACVSCDETGDYEANAKLIAAAPQLLSELTDLIEYLGEDWQNDTQVLKAKAIINKLNS